MAGFSLFSKVGKWGKMDCAAQSCHWDKNLNALQKL